MTNVFHGQIEVLVDQLTKRGINPSMPGEGVFNQVDQLTKRGINPSMPGEGVFNHFLPTRKTDNCKIIILPIRYYRDVIMRRYFTLFYQVQSHTNNRFHHPRG